MIRIKKNFIYFLSIALFTVSVMVFSIDTYALDAGIVETTVSTGWDFIYPSNLIFKKPINSWLWIGTLNYGFTHLDIAMYGKNGNLVWEECCAIDRNQSRRLYCGSDVYYVMARSHFSGLSISDWRIVVSVLKN